MVDGHKSLSSENAHSSSRSHCIPLYGCQSLRMGSSSRTDETIRSWSLVGRPIPTPYQYTGNNGHSFRTEESHKKYTPFLCHHFYRNTTVVSYINKRGETHSTNLCVEVWQILHRCLKHDVVIRVRHIPGKFSRIDKPFKIEWPLNQSNANSILQMLNVDAFATRFNHKLLSYVSAVPDNHALAIDALSMNWNLLHAYACPSTIQIPSVLAKIRQSRCKLFLIAPLWPQR